MATKNTAPASRLVGDGTVVEAPFVRNPYNYDRDGASVASGLLCEDPSLAKDSFREEADINTIVRRFHLTGELPQGVRMPTYADFGSEIFDFHSAMNAIAQAGEAFDAMPAEVRARFQNDPAAFVDFCSKEENREEALKMGLVDPEKAQARREAPKAPEVNPTTPKAPEAVVVPPEGGAK